MKKFYTLFIAVLVAATASAQVTIKDLGMKKQDKMPYKGIMKPAKSGIGEGWIFYQDFLESYFGDECAEAEYAFRLNFDSIGLYTYSDGDVGHPFLFSVSQAFDLEADFYDYASEYGDISLIHSPSLNIDSILIYTMYLRDENIPANTKDTIIVGIIADDNLPIYSFTAYENTCFMYAEYNPATGTQNNAQIFKFPIGEEDVSEPADQPGYYYVKAFQLPINMNNVTAKRWHISYTFKPGYEIAMNDTIRSTFTTYYFMTNDPAGYSYQANNPNMCENVSNGSMVLAFSDGEVSDYYYPTFLIDDIDFVQNLGLKVSCSNCEMVNVRKDEKKNITVYPNPATNNFTVETGSDEKASIQLFNIVGQQVYSETFTDKTTVNVANLHSGVYMLKVNQNGKVYTSKLIVK